MIYIASDHAGFSLKNEIVSYLKQSNIPRIDIGPHTFNKLDDYPDFIIPAAEKVAQNLSENKGIILGYSGQGEAIAANKVKGIRAIVYYGGPKDLITLSRVHNNANILSLGAGFLSPKEAIEVVQLWLGTDYLKEERHARRIQKILDYELHKI